MSAKYDTIGVDYADLRKSDSRIAAMINAALGDAETVLNVGAGSGSYEPAARKVTALEPSIEMIGQRPPDAAPCHQGVAEALPFDDNSFDAAMAVLTIHHWTDQPKGIAEMRRVARGPIVVLTYDPDHRGFWLIDYLPELATLDDSQMPRLDFYRDHLGPTVQIDPVPIPHDCSDGFLAAYWRRPAAYLDPRIRAAISSFWAIEDVDTKLKPLAADLESGAWEQRYAHLLDQDAWDQGYRLVTATAGN